MRGRSTCFVAAAAYYAAAASAAHGQRPLQGEAGVGTLAHIYAQVAAAPSVSASSLDGCVVVHDVWKPEVVALHGTEARSDERVHAFERDVRKPYETFWQGYIGSTEIFARWVRERLDITHDARRALPVRLDVGRLITETTADMSSFTGRRGCGDWYAVFGPGRTDMGSLGRRRIVVDFLGMRADVQPAELRATVAHEINHLIFGERRERDPHAGTVLYRMIDEGFAAYVAHRYADAASSPARALSWTEDELRWALAHEKELWTMLQRYFDSQHADVHDAFFLYDQQVRPGAPGKIGYFLGYRIVEAYVQRHGAESWRQLYDMDVADILWLSRLLRDTGVVNAPARS